MPCAIGSASNWWLRSANSTTNFRNVNNNGNVNNNNANNSNGVALGFFSDRRSSLRARPASVQEEKERMTVPARGESGSRRVGRTLLAWRRLAVIRRSMPSPYAHTTTAEHGCATHLLDFWGQMNSDERREARYLRRKAKREARRAEAKRGMSDLAEVMSYGHLYAAYRRCRRDVQWKGSVQRYVAQAPLNVLTTHRRLVSGTYRPKEACAFDIRDRGKLRHIRSVGIADRVVQRCVCDNMLVPLLSRSFVYDNGASLVGKGYHFAHGRLAEHLRWHYRRHGTEGYVLLFDLHDFFGSIDRGRCKEAVRRVTDDAGLVRLCDRLIDSNGGDRGLDLGNQTSQILALAAGDRLDHHVKEVLRVHCYGRYMDDGYLIHHSKAYLRECLRSIREVAESCGLTLNERKTRVVRLTRGFTWCKAHYRLTETGRVVRTLDRRTIVRMRRRLKAFRRKVDAGVMTTGDAWQSYQSWRAYAATFDAARTIRDMDRLFHELFGEGETHGEH